MKKNKKMRRIHASKTPKRIKLDGAKRVTEKVIVRCVGGKIV